MRAVSQESAASGVLPERLVLAALVVVAGLLRFSALDRAGLWLDEAMSWWFARASWGELLSALRYDSGPPGYYLLLKAWMALFGSSERALRSLSALVGTALVAALYAAGKRMFSARAGLLAAALAAVSPLAVRYSQEARGYAFLALASLGAWLGLESWLVHGRRRWLLLTVVSLVAALYTHYYAVFLLAAVGFYLGFLVAADRDWRSFQRGSIALGLALCGWMPWWPHLGRQLEQASPVAWMAEIWQAQGGLGALWASAQALAPGGAAPPYLGLPRAPGPAWLGGLVTWLAAAVAGWGIAAVVRGHFDGEPCRGLGRRRAVGLVCFVVIPLLVGWLYSATLRPVYLAARIDQLVLPAFFLALGVGLDRLPKKLAVACATVWLVTSGLVLSRYYREPLPAGEREAAEQLARMLRPGDFLLTTSLSRAPLAYYLREREEDFRWQVFPLELGLHPGNEDLSAWSDVGPELTREARDLVAEWERDGDQGAVAFVPNPATAHLLEAIRNSRTLNQADLEEGFTQRLLGQPLTLMELSWATSPAPEP